MHVAAKLEPRAKSHELISCGVAPRDVAASKIRTAELVKPTITAINPAVMLANEKYLNIVGPRQSDEHSVDLGCADNCPRFGGNSIILLCKLRGNFNEIIMSIFAN